MRDVALLLHGRRQLLRAEHETSVTGQRDDFGAAGRGLGEGGCDGPRHPDSEGLLAVGAEEAAGLVGAEVPHDVDVDGADVAGDGCGGRDAGLQGGDEVQGVHAGVLSAFFRGLHLLDLG